MPNCDKMNFMVSLRIKGSAENNERQIIRAAFQKAQDILGKLSDALDIENPPPHIASIASWYRNSFGRFSVRRAGFVKCNIDTLCDYLNSEEKLYINLYADRRASLTQNISPEDTYAFTNLDTGEITFERKFYELSSEDDQACIVIHELTHLLCNTEDYELTTEGLRQGEVRQYAIENPKNAVKCAYCYELFAQSYREIPENRFAHDVKEIKRLANQEENSLTRTKKRCLE